MIVSVEAAFLASGLRKAGTPLRDGLDAGEGDGAGREAAAG